MNPTKAKAFCVAKEKKLMRLTCRHCPNNYNVAVLFANKDPWTDMISTALDDLVDSVQSMTLVHEEAVREA